MSVHGSGAERTAEICAKVEAFVRDVVISHEKETWRASHGPTDALPRLTKLAWELTERVGET